MPQPPGKHTAAVVAVIHEPGQGQNSKEGETCSWIRGAVVPRGWSQSPLFFSFSILLLLGPEHGPKRGSVWQNRVTRAPSFGVEDQKGELQGTGKYWGEIVERE